jgi:hypothetical protein
MYDKPQKRAGRPVLNAKPFRVDKDPWRHVWRTGFGVDYLRYFSPEHILQAAALPGAPASVDSAHEFKLLELNQWRENDEGNSYAVHGYDVFVQRLSVYVQRNMDGAGLVEDDWDDVPNPYVREEARRMSAGLGVTQDKEMREKEMKAVLDKYDNSEFGPEQGWAEMGADMEQIRRLSSLSRAIRIWSGTRCCRPETRLRTNG